MSKKADFTKIVIPRSEAGANKFIQRISNLQLEETHIKQKAEEDIEEIKNQRDEKIERIKKKERIHLMGVFLYCRNIWKKLSPKEKRKKKKILKFLSGDAKFYKTGVVVDVRDEEKAVKNLRRLGFADYIRKKEVVDKEAIRRRREIADQVEEIVIIESKARFGVKPERTKILLSEEVQELKKFLS